MFSENAHVCPFGNSGMPQEEATKSAQFVKHLFFFFKHTVTLYYIHLIFPIDQIIFNRDEKRETVIIHDPLTQTSLCRHSDSSPC